MCYRELNLLLLILLDYASLGETVKVKNNVNLQNVYFCPENDRIKDPMRNLIFTKINRTHSALSMDFSYAEGVDENTGFLIQLDRWSDGGWVEWPFLGKQRDMCRTTMKLFPSIWINMMKDTNITNPDKCPIPPGHYHLENHIFDFSTLHPPVRLGKFRITVKVTDSGYKELYYCLMIVVSVDQEAKDD